MISKSPLIFSFGFHAIVVVTLAWNLQIVPIVPTRPEPVEITVRWEPSRAYAPPSTTAEESESPSITRLGPSGSRVPPSFRGEKRSIESALRGEWEPQAKTPSEELSEVEPRPPVERPADVGDFLRIDRPAVIAPAEETAPVLLSEIAPVYPARCRRRGHEGEVVLDIGVDKSGRVTDARVVQPSTCKRLDQAARTTALSLRYEPGTFEGEAISSRVRLTIRFRLEGSGEPRNLESTSLDTGS